VFIFQKRNGLLCLQKGSDIIEIDACRLCSLYPVEELETSCSQTFSGDDTKIVVVNECQCRELAVSQTSCCHSIRRKSWKDRSNRNRKGNISNECLVPGMPRKICTITSNRFQQRIKNSSSTRRKTDFVSVRDTNVLHLRFNLGG